MKLKSFLAKSTSLLFVLSFLFYSNSLHAQNFSSVAGKVTDELGNGLSGVTVSIKGATEKVVTNQDGTYKINVPSGKKALVFTYVGYQPVDLVINNKSVVNISMAQLSKALEDVIVIGYGSQKRKNVTGAVSSFDTKNLDERPIQRVDQALVGQMPGVTVKQTTGMPGKGFSIQIRGTGSISGGNEPLYVIDGFPLTPNSSNTSSGSFSTGNPLDNINPNDIESIQVLKDAAAAAIYGSRANNGVVLITTKRGQAGKAKLSFNAYGGYNQASKILEMQNGDQWIATATEVIDATYLATYPTASVTDTYAQRLARVGSINASLMEDPRWTMPGHPGLEYVDWQKAIERKGGTQNYELSASGGTDKVRYFMSGNLGNQDGFVIGVGYKVYSMRANLEVNATKNLKFGVNIAPTYSVTQDPGVEGKDNIFHQALSLGPVQEDTMGLFANALNVSTGANEGGYTWSSSTNSPYAKVLYKKGTSKRYRTLGTIYGEYQIIPGLNFRSSLNLDNTDNISSGYSPYTIAGTQAARTFTGTNNVLAATSGSYSSYRRQTFVNENTLTYGKTFHHDHNLNLLAGYSYSFDRLDQVAMSSSGGYTNATVQTLSAAAAITGASTSSTQKVFISYFSRLLYNYKEKYFLSASIRRDGSSVFGVNDQFASFPGISLGWVLTQENFMKDLPILSYFKLRASYGENGNENLPNNYASIATLGSAGYIGGTTAIALIGQTPNVLANPNLQWEKSATKNLGFDFGILKNRITGSFDLYNKLNTNLLFNSPVLGATGFASSLTNVGSVRNIGQELELTSHNLVGKFQWNTTVTLAHNGNKIVALSGGATQVIIPNSFDVSDAILRVGSPINSTYVLKTIGFISADDIAKNAAQYGKESIGDFKYQDTNGDGIINESDKVIVGHPNPDYTYGVTNTFRYKGFDLSVFVQGQSGGTIFSSLGRAISRAGQGRSDNRPASYVNRWESPTQLGEGRFSKAYTTYLSPITSATDWVYSSDYFRVRNITIGYNLKKPFKPLGVQSARFYFSLENFFGHDKYTNGLNPEATNTTISSNSAYPEAGDYGAIPLPKALIIGLNVTF